MSDERVTGRTFPRPVDLETVPLELGSDGASSFLLGPPLLRHDGALYGGTAIAVSVMAMEAATQSDVQWVTTQFVLPGQNGDRIELQTDVLASGRRTAQLRVTGSVGGRVIFASLGSTGHRRADGLTGAFERMPDVGGPDDAGEMWTGNTRPHEHEETFRRMVEYRRLETPEGSNRVMLWSRFIDGRPMTPARLAFVADMVPMAVARAAGKFGAGTSLDNSMRFGVVPDVEWVLLALEGNLASGGYGHGTVRAWSQDGAYLAIGGQTASMTHMFDADDEESFFAKLRDAAEQAR